MSSKSRPGSASSFGGDGPFVGDYIRTEFLNQLSPRITSFLVRTSALDEMNGAICDAILEERRIGRHPRITIAAEPSGYPPRPPGRVVPVSPSPPGPPEGGTTKTGTGPSPRTPTTRRALARSKRKQRAHARLCAVGQRCRPCSPALLSSRPRLVSTWPLGSGQPVAGMVQRTGSPKGLPRNRTHGGLDTHPHRSSGDGYGLFSLR